MSQPTQPAPKPAREFTYFCRVCCATFYGAAAHRHREFMARTYREGKREPIQRIA